MVAATSADVKSVPSCHLTPLRSSKVHSLPSALGVHFSARPGAMSLSPRVVRYSKLWAMIP